MSIELIKELRAKTHFGMTDCKNALQEAAGDMEKAISILQKKGLKKIDSLFEAVEGEVRAHSYGNRGAIAEINCQTDFAARSEPFQKFVNDLFTKRELAFAPAPEVADEQKQLSAVLGEAVKMRRIERLSVKDGFVAAYNHPGGKIAVLASFFTQNGSHVSDEEREVAGHVLMHIAAANPKYINRTDVPVDLVQKQKEIFFAELPPGKSAEQNTKIIEGKLNRWFGEMVLTEQNSIVDPKKTIKTVIKESGSIGCVLEFHRFERGEVLK